MSRYGKRTSTRGYFLGAIRTFVSLAIVFYIGYGLLKSDLLLPSTNFAQICENRGIELRLTDPRHFITSKTGGEPTVQDLFCHLYNTVRTPPGDILPEEENFQKFFEVLNGQY